jgi:hypothetical protein
MRGKRRRRRRRKRLEKVKGTRVDSNRGGENREGIIE